jgi:hypothetical protein
VRNLIQGRRPEREHRRVGRPSRLSNTLKGAFASSAESVASTDAVAQRADRREAKAHERMGRQVWRPGSGEPRDLKEDQAQGSSDRSVDAALRSSLGGAAPVCRNGWPAGRKPRSRGMTRPMPADVNVGGFGTTVANTENVPSGSRPDGTWVRGPGTGQHPPKTNRSHTDRVAGLKLRRAACTIEPQERCRIGAS